MVYVLRIGGDPASHTVSHAVPSAIDKRRSERRHLDPTEGVNFSGNFRVRDGKGRSLFAIIVEKHFGREQIGGGEK
ncbi:hypothetical protein [Desulfosediminicola sp.]|uniref:hypothetical protein n=1 Tax=Desulfosediminicola sp. TaxID=2886825 RepID=UPI003AF2E20D